MDQSDCTINYLNIFELMCFITELIVRSPIYHGESEIIREWYKGQLTSFLDHKHKRITDYVTLTFRLFFGEISQWNPQVKFEIRKHCE